METLRIKKRHGIYWYKHTCKCGHITYIPLLFLNIRFSFTRKIYIQCRKCGYTSSIRCNLNIHTDTADTHMKEINKDFNEKHNSRKIWRQG